ncbi:hypothetical protein [Sphingobium sp. Ndbn-10]|uniref:hypothetical protein n=1 Tax=Sphingobium sp. Ndbn-10 TaxID=1667223 RepID=UPI00111206A6|nr:hypothetical protein [Sphingobium sp. Ndbn-10]
MRVALLRTDGVLFATGQLTESSSAAQIDGGRHSSDWVVRDLELLPTPVNLPADDGPLWRRLKSMERDILTGKIDKEPLSEPATQHHRSLPTETAGFAGDTLEPSVDGSGWTTDTLVHQAIDDAITDQGWDYPANKTEEISATCDKNVSPLASIATTDQRTYTLEGARDRALAFVPAGMIDTDEAYRLLVQLRDKEIKLTFPDVRPEFGILRRSMLQALLDSGVASKAEYDDLIPVELKRMTDRGQIETYLDPLLKILSCVS